MHSSIASKISIRLIWSVLFLDNRMLKTKQKRANLSFGTQSARSARLLGLPLPLLSCPISSFPIFRSSNFPTIGLENCGRLICNFELVPSSSSSSLFHQHWHQYSTTNIICPPLPDVVLPFTPLSSFNNNDLVYFAHRLAITIKTPNGVNIWPTWLCHYSRHRFLFIYSFNIHFRC